MPNHNSQISNKKPIKSSFFLKRKINNVLKIITARFFYYINPNETILY